MRCLSCGFENPEGMNFCGKCATPLIDKTPALKPTQISEAERRQLTIMFCDLVGFTSLSEQLDPEELHDVMRVYQDVCAKVISRFEGHIAKYLGDGLLVYFGYPVAHEDDAQRAVRAGLGIVGAIHELPLHERLQPPLRVRVGMHTGLVVVGEMGRDIVGETPNIAARLQEIAESDTVVISSATYRLIRGYFECHDNGLQSLKGISTPVQVYRVVGESGARSGFEGPIGVKLTPLMGREKEVEVLLGCWEQVKRGEGQVVLINGEPGIGKSRLLQVIRQHVSREAHVWLKSRCIPYYRNSSLYPVIDLLEGAFEFRREDSSEEKFSKLEREVGAYRDTPLQDSIPLFASLLSLPLPERYPPFTLSPQKQKERTLEALLEWLMRIAKIQPVLFVVEDLHWVDPSTLELLSLLIDRVSKASIFALFTFRPEFDSPWASPRIASLSLSRLDGKEAELIALCSGMESLLQVEHTRSRA